MSRCRVIKEIKKYTFDIVFIVISLLLALVSSPEDIKDKILIFSASFLPLEFVRISYLLLEIREKMCQDHEEWEIRDTFEKYLHNLRCYMREIISDRLCDNDLFVDYYSDQLNKLSILMRDSAVDKKLKVTSSHFESTEKVMSAFRKSNFSIYRSTWRIDCSSQLFDDHDRTYFSEIYKLIENDHHYEHKAIFFLNDQNVLSETRMKNLIYFFNLHKKMHYKIIKEEQLEGICRDSNLDGRFLDFGIFGDKLLFLTKSYEPHPVGEFIKRSEDIRRYIEFFDKLWEQYSSINSSSDRALRPISKPRVTLDELFNADECDSLIEG